MLHFVSTGWGMGSWCCSSLDCCRFLPKLGFLNCRIPKTEETICLFRRFTHVSITSPTQSYSIKTLFFLHPFFLVHILRLFFIPYILTSNIWSVFIAHTQSFTIAIPIRWSTTCYPVYDLFLIFVYFWVSVSLLIYDCWQYYR